MVWPPPWGGSGEWLDLPGSPRRYLTPVQGSPQVGPQGHQSGIPPGGGPRAPQRDHPSAPYVPYMPHVGPMMGHQSSVIGRFWGGTVRSLVRDWSVIGSGGHNLLFERQRDPPRGVPKGTSKPTLLKSYRNMSLSESDRIMLTVRFARCRLFVPIGGLYLVPGCSSGPPLG